MPANFFQMDIDISTTILSLHEKCPNTELFMVRIFPYSVPNSHPYFPVLGPEKSPYFYTFHAVSVKVSIGA